MRSNRVPKSFFQDCLKVTVPMLVFCLAVGPTLIFSSSRWVDAHGDSSKLAQQPQTVRQQLGKPQRVFAPHWTTEDGFQTLVYIRNVHIERAVTTRLSLVLDHRTITLAPTLCRQFRSMWRKRWQKTVKSLNKAAAQPSTSKRNPPVKSTVMLMYLTPPEA